MPESAKLVVELLDYIEEVEKLKTRPAFSVPTEFFALAEHELQGLPEVGVNLQSDDDDLWLRVPRLKELAPPDPGEPLKPWIQFPKSPGKTPQLKETRAIVEGRRQVATEQLADHPELRGLFDWYVEFHWTPWAAAERERRRTIDLYNRLFAFQQLIASQGSETAIELVWGIGMAAWKKDGVATPLRFPLLTQTCDVRLDMTTFALEVRPRTQEPRLELDCFAEMGAGGLTQLERFWQEYRQGDPNITPFDEASFEGLLRAAVANIDATGRYESRTEDFTPPPATDKLLITGSWILFARRRAGDVFIEDVRRLKKKIEARSEALPAVVRSFVETGADEVHIQPEIAFRGLSTSAPVAGARELYFPMPYNDEQVSIVRKLEANDGVVVQGPPGTGKTHTIANVICHFLAQGKRVLVTSKGETALTVLQEKLPAEIRALGVALLSEDREGMKQFEYSIQTIASEVERLDPNHLKKDIERLEARIEELHAKIACVDGEIGKHAAEHLRRYAFRGGEVTAEDLARIVADEADQHAWFDDDPPDPRPSGLGFKESDIAELRQARARLGIDLSHLGAALPVSGSFPAWEEALTLHRALVRGRHAHAEILAGRIPALVATGLESADLDEIGACVAEYESLSAAVAGDEISAALERRLQALAADDPLLVGLAAACASCRELEDLRRGFIAKVINVPERCEHDRDFCVAVARLAQGRRAFGWFGSGGEAGAMIKAVTVLGKAPDSPQAWEEVQALLQWRLRAHSEIARWNALAAELGLATAAGGQVEQAIRDIAATVERVARARSLVHESRPRLRARLQETLGAEAPQWLSEQGGLARIRSIYATHLERARGAAAERRVQLWLGKLADKSGELVERMRRYLRNLGDAGAIEDSLRADWQTIQAEVRRLNGLVPMFVCVERVTSLIRSAGAPKWATCLRTIPAAPAGDAILPAAWWNAWTWRKAERLLARIDAYDWLRAQFHERRQLTAILARSYGDLVAKRTWLGVILNSPVSVRQALQSYLDSVKAMGSGHGVRAIRHRRHAREAMNRAYMAVPCWILPHWRVSEAIPSEIGLFDVVIIDEASQSDIWALPALLRGKKLLVVGDDKQVSPAVVGLAEQKIVDLEKRFLGRQPHGAQMTPDKSIYDLAKVVFAGNSVMLREHFRSVPAIIEFSKREFYDHKIVPLRIPKATERLDPPLIDVFVKGATRKGEKNLAEARAILAEMVRIIDDPEMKGRSIGVVTLIGTEQAKLISDMIAKAFAPAEIVERKIAVGPPPVFQGRERDIMMISMVAVPGNSTAPNLAAQHQRHNVALSRARDRMYLFRSVHESDFPPGSLSARVIAHFRRPFMTDPRKADSLRALCESDFEREMFDELSARGYRVQPQVACGVYRIDFVVEGLEGRRLAVECDGDRFHGPAHWAEDMERQRVLERAGWTFWRCFASSFVRRRAEVMNDLLATLAQMGIEPLGPEPVDASTWVQSVEADPFGVEESFEEDVAEDESMEAVA